MWNKIVNGVPQTLLSTKAVLITLLNLSIIPSHWSLSENITHERICIFQIEFCAKCWEKGICLDSNQTAQLLQIAMSKSLETMSGLILNWLQEFATKVYSQICSKWNAMFESHIETCIDWMSFNFQFEDFFSSLLLKIIIYFLCVLLTNHSHG